MLVVITAHPHPDRARANRALTKAITGLEGVEVRSLYDLYPDFDIDVAKEREALDRATTVVFQHPIYWYSPPALFKLWLENVLTAGYAYGDDGRALAGKRCLWVATTGGDDEGYTPAGDARRTVRGFRRPDASDRALLRHDLARTLHRSRRASDRRGDARSGRHTLPRAARLAPRDGDDTRCMSVRC
jgi:glutathione-regulated potassium-efflux system ancillary protein KefF